VVAILGCIFNSIWSHVGVETRENLLVLDFSVRELYLVFNNSFFIFV
jgi:hypothetical protein